MEFSFDAFIYAWHIVPLLLSLTLYGLLVLTGTVFVVFSLLNWLEVTTSVSIINALLGLSIGLFFGGKLFKTIARLWRAQWEKSTFGGLVFFQVQQLKPLLVNSLSNHLLLRRPMLLVIDNLDRATLAQQRSLLRSLYKHQQLLHFHVLVVMDETALMNNPGDPEKPEELLRKVIQAEFRLPPRVVESIVLQAVHLCHRFANLNQNRVDVVSEQSFTASSVFKDPWFVVDFVQMLSRMPHPGPRLMKRLLNDTAIAVSSYSVPLHVLDVVCVVKLKMLHLLAPTLDMEPEQAYSLLILNNDGQIESVTETLQLNKNCTHFLKATTHIQPAMRGFNWRYLLGLSTRPGGDCSADTLNKSRLEFAKGMQALTYELCIEGAKNLDDMSNNRNYDLNLPYVNHQFSLAHGDYLYLCLFAIKHTSYSHEQRLCTYRRLRAEIRKSNDSEPVLLLPLIRFWLADHQVWQLMHDNEKQGLWAVIQTEFSQYYHCLVYLIEDSFFNTSRVLDLVRSAEGVGGRDDQRIWQKWHSTDELACYEKLPFKYLDAVFLRLVWPGLPLPGASVQCLRELDNQLDLLFYLNPGEFPDNLRHSLFLDGHWDSLLPATKLKLLHKLCLISSDKQFESRWRAKWIGAILNGHEQAVLEPVFAESEYQLLADEHNLHNTLWFLLACFFDFLPGAGEYGSKMPKPKTDLALLKGWAVECLNGGFWSMLDENLMLELLKPLGTDVDWRSIVGHLIGRYPALDSALDKLYGSGASAEQTNQEGQGKLVFNDFETFMAHVKRGSFDSEGDFLRWYREHLPDLLIGLESTNFAMEHPDRMKVTETFNARVHRVIALYQQLSVEDSPEFSEEEDTLVEMAWRYLAGWLGRKSGV